MTDTAPLVSLAALDDVVPLTPDPGIWSKNLAALEAKWPALAARLEQTLLPPHWRPVRALDGSPTFRTEAPDEPPTWLAGSAVPRARAEGVLAFFEPGDLNSSLPTIAAGAELLLLLERLPAYRAVYVFEADWVMLAAVLRTLDLAEPLTRDRCLFVPPAGELGFLQEYLARHPGLLPPGNIPVLPGVAPERIEKVRQICERIARQTHATRTARLQQLQASAAVHTSATESKPRLAVIALTVDRTLAWASAALERAATRTGWPTVRCGLGGPVDAHPLGHCERLASFSPSIALYLHPPSVRLPLALGGVTCEWFTSATDVPAQLPADDVLRLAASPRVASALRAATAPGAKSAGWYWGCDPKTSEAFPHPRDDVIGLIADWPNDDPAACGIEQPSHKQLWRHLQQLAADRWETQDVLQPVALLAHAERATGLRLGEPSLRPWLLRLIERVLIPAAVLKRIAEVATSASIRLEHVGLGHDPRPDSPIPTIAGSVFALIESESRPRPSAAIFGGAVDPLTPALLQAGHSGWPLLLHSPGRTSRAAALGNILHPEQHYQPFAGPAELRGVLRAVREQAERFERRAARTREHLRTTHSYERRLADLARHVQM